MRAAEWVRAISEAIFVETCVDERVRNSEGTMLPA